MIIVIRETSSSDWLRQFLSVLELLEIAEVQFEVNGDEGLVLKSLVL
jgi:hypothetical protein